MYKAKCSCSKQANYSHRFESHYCGICNIWLEKRCDDPDCKYCVDRPERPLCVERVEEPGNYFSH